MKIMIRIKNYQLSAGAVNVPDFFGSYLETLIFSAVF